MKRGRRLYRNPDDKNEKEARNARLQFRQILKLVPVARGGLSADGSDLRITPDIIKALHYTAMKGIYSCAGNYREWPVRIRSSRHAPPESRFIPGLVQAMCERANDRNWDPVETAAFLLWKLAWIHPFAGGNGRTSRAVCHLALCVRLGFIIPGNPTIGQYVDSNRDRYLAALVDADQAWRSNVIDVHLMSEFLYEMLKEGFSGIPDRTA